MAIESHLAELEKRHQALEQEINEALTHPSTDDLQIAELEAQKIARKGRDRASAARRLRSLVDQVKTTGLTALVPAKAGAHGVFRVAHSVPRPQ